ncbi:MAG TPA: hypothetical protein VL523_04575 [Terriglobia bacterium]|nr:hypothetical protein [Terriglobia bacterium]
MFADRSSRIEVRGLGSPGRRRAAGAREIQNVTNEPTNLLKTLIFHFWNPPDPTKLFKTKVIRSLSNHHTEKNGDNRSARLGIGPHSSEMDRLAGREGICETGARENKKCYERTRQVTENIDIPFLEFVGSRQLIENKHDTVNMPSGC